MTDGPPPSPGSEPSPSAGPDEQLLLRVGAGDRPAFEALYARFARPLMTFLHAHVHDAALSEDLLQETFLRVWRAAPRWVPRARASTFLFTVARSVALNALTRRGRRAAALARAARAGAGRPSRPEDVAGATAEAARGPDADDLRARLAAALSALPETLRGAVVLVRLVGLPLAEAAEILDVPVGTVKSRVAAAEARLRQRLEPGEGPTA